MSTRIPGFYRLTAEQRLEMVAEAADLTQEERDLLCGRTPLEMTVADRMVENAIGYMSIPLGIGLNFKINGMDRFVPMATEEPSVIAAASHAAKLAYQTGGFHVTVTGSIMRGQIQVVGISDPYGAMGRIYENKEALLQECNAKDPTLVSLGGGAKDLEVHVIETAREKMVVVHLLVDTKDAMGANSINTMAEAVAPKIESITGGQVILRIISNLADRRLVRARAVFESASIGGDAIVQNILRAYEFAEADPYRAATHNKGIMNGISAVVLATGNDTRAIEAGAHAYASRSGQYRSLTHWEVNSAGNLVGTLEMPLAVGIVGGATRSHPIAQLALKIMKVRSVEELSGVIAAVGLAQNFAAVRALSAEGIQEGHMALHARNLAVMAGAKGWEIDQTVELAVQAKDVRFDTITNLLTKVRNRR